MIIDTWTFVLLSSTAFIQVQTLRPEFHKTKYYIYICKCKKKSPFTPINPFMIGVIEYRIE